MKKAGIVALVLGIGLSSFGIPQMNAGQKIPESPKKGYPIGESEALIASRLEKEEYVVERNY
jgi:hypothetical protein